MTRTILDKLDRVVIPKDICKTLNLVPGSSVLFSVSNGSVMITPEECVCSTCGKRIERDSVIRICKECTIKAKTFYEAQEEK